MTATEKLLLQIFERKNSIIERVKQQTELYSQHLASKLLIDGITPPSWLWNPSASTSEENNSNELNKEELLSKLLCPLQQSSYYPVYDKVVFRGDNEVLSDGFFMENPAPSVKDHSVVPTLGREDRAGCNLNCVPEPETSATSPEEQPDERVVNIYNAPDQSLSRIQRSKSRQKALQLRNSGKTVTRSDEVNKNVVDASSSHIKFSLPATNWVGQDDKPLKSTEPCVNGSQSCAEQDEKVDSQSKEKEKNDSTCRISSSRCHSKVPDFVRGPLSLGCSSENFKENASHVEVRRTQSMHISDSQKADDNYVNKWSKSAGPTSTIYCQSQSCGDALVHGEYCLDKGTDDFTDRITRSTNISNKCQSRVRDSSKAVLSSSDGPIIDTVMTNDLPPDYVYGSPLDPSNVLIEGRDSRESISSDCRNHKSNVHVPSCSSNQQNAGLDGVSDLEIHSHSAKADGSILALSEKSAQEVNDSKEVHVSVKPSVGLSAAMSLTQSHSKELYEPVAYNEEVCDLEISSHPARVSGGILASSGKSVQEVKDSKEVHGYVKPSVGLSAAMSLAQSHSKELYEPVAYNEEVSDLEISSHPARVSGGILASSGKSVQEVNDSKEVHGYVKPSVGLSAAMSLTQSRDKELYEPVAYNEEVSDLEISSHSARVSGAILASSGKSSQQVNDSKEVHGYVKPSVGLSAAMSLTQSHDKELYEPVAYNEEVSDLEVSSHSARVSGGILASSGKSSQQGDWSGKRFRHADLESWPQLKRRKNECNNTHSLTTSPNFRARKPQSTQGKHASTYLKNTEVKSDSDVDAFHVDNHADIEIPPEMTSNSVEGVELIFSSENGEVELCSKEKNEHRTPSSFINNEQLESALVSSLKKDLIDSQGGFIEELSNTNSSSSHFDASKLGDEHHSQHLCNLEKDIDYTSTANLSPTNTMLDVVQQASHSVPSPRTEDRELIDVDQSMPEHVGLIEELGNTNSSSSHFDASKLGDVHHSQHLCNLEKDIDCTSTADLSPTNTMLDVVQQASHSVLSPRTDDRELIDVDQFMPEHVGLTVDTQEDSDALNFAEYGIDYDKLTLPSNTIDCASFLAEICRSASLDKPSSHFSSAFEFQRNQNLHQPVPNDHLERLDLSSSLSLNSDVGKQFQFGRSSVNDCNQALEGMPCSVSPAYSGKHYGWNLRSQYTSPVGKLWERERLSSHTGSSEKRLSSNPELTCFPIDEDASISEGNKTVDENEGDVQEADSSLAKQSDKREPLKDLSNLGLNPLSASAHATTLTTNFVDFASSKLSVAGAQDNIQPDTENQYMNNNETSEKQNSSIGGTDGRKNQFSLHGTSGIKKAKESIKNSIGKSSLSVKTSLKKRQDQKLSLKDSRRNNIISNVSSFIPLVKQKQAATLCAGKRDLKVKALEAAEAAKRLEEKRENERKMKKEALKLERAKMEEKNLRQLELEKQQKEKERKKKDAIIIAKKTQREEEDRNEREKKRRRLEVRQRQRGEEKSRAGKAEKENRWSKDEQMNSKKELLTESKKQQNREFARGDDVALKKADTLLTATNVVRNYEECGSSGQYNEVGKAMHAVDNSPRNEDLIVNNNKEKSYEISPYQCSDDEEENDALPARKYIPSWASKSSVDLLLPLQQHIDPDTIFPPGCFCSMEEVLLPRALQQK